MARISNIVWNRKPWRKMPLFAAMISRKVRWHSLKSDSLSLKVNFAQAYVIAHEVGHHVQHLLGISDKVQQLRARSDEAQANALSVRLELQADCFAGLWANHADRARQVLEQGDVEEALNAATAIGDDTLQKQARGYAVPESFTHGTAKQRVSWFKRGLTSGSIKSCDTFAKTGS